MWDRAQTSSATWCRSTATTCLTPAAPTPRSAANLISRGCQVVGSTVPGRCPPKPWWRQMWQRGEAWISVFFCPHVSVLTNRFSSRSVDLQLKKNLPSTVKFGFLAQPVILQFTVYRKTQLKEIITIYLSSRLIWWRRQHKCNYSSTHVLMMDQWLYELITLCIQSDSFMLCCPFLICLLQLWLTPDYFI